MEPTTRCIHCGKPAESLTALPCTHSVCGDCLATQIETIFSHEGDKATLAHTVCPQCGKPVPKDLLSRESVGGPNWLLLRKAYGLLCVYCGGYAFREDTITLSCSHVHDISCIRSDIEEKIGRKDISPERLCCLKAGCATPLTEAEILYLISKEQYNAIKQIRIDIAEGKYNDIKEGKAGELSEKSWERLEKENIKQCQCCDIMVRRTTGCNCISCTGNPTRPNHGKKDHFMCYLCGLKIYTRDSSTHFLNEPCNGITTRHCPLLP